ncbi:hypothetical protein HBB16_01335 [Pseudonocardia sp. MCCB 268]|nr:hypothetical protein [Pseudonocardia cytotoxica]
MRAELAALSPRSTTSTSSSPGPGWTPSQPPPRTPAQLMHRSVALGLPAPRGLSSVPRGVSTWEPGVSPLRRGRRPAPGAVRRPVQVVGRMQSQAVSATSRGAVRGADGDLHASPRSTTRGCSTRNNCRSPSVVSPDLRAPARRTSQRLQRQMEQVRSQIGTTPTTRPRPPMSLARQADRVLEVEDELTTGLAAQHPALRLVADRRVRPGRGEATTRAQQVVGLYRPKGADRAPQAQYRYAREFIPGELASTAYRRRQRHLGGGRGASRDRIRR